MAVVSLKKKEKTMLPFALWQTSSPNYTCRSFNLLNAMLDAQYIHVNGYVQNSDQCPCTNWISNQ